MGTLMQFVHALPGTTFSNPAERGDYDSDKAACLTFEDLERWLAVAITKYYHLRPHEGIDGEIPLHRYEQGLQSFIAANKTLPVPRDPRTFLIDFLPVVRRSLQRDGITIDHITYCSNALRPWIQLRNQPTPLLIRRDPRDLSRVFVLDAENNAYLEVPYRVLSRPAITLWEHKLARKRLREQRRTAIDEASLFAAIDEMRVVSVRLGRLRAQHAAIEHAAPLIRNRKVWQLKPRHPLRQSILASPTRLRTSNHGKPQSPGARCKRARHATGSRTSCPSQNGALDWLHPC